jgi:hypothetical protein
MTQICDNQGAINIATSSLFHEHTKHIEVDCHFVCDKLVNEETIRKSEDQLANLFTKALGHGRVAYIV